VVTLAERGRRLQAPWRKGGTAERRNGAAAFVGISAALVVLLVGQRATAQAPTRWYKGNTHTHTLNSDGDSSPDEVARWYREHGYQFLVLSDHNYLTSVDGINALIGADEKFLLIPGEEITDRFGDKPIHINGLAVTQLVRPQGGASVADVIQRDIDAIRAANGLPSLNHPNFGWAVTAEDMKKLRNDRLFEIYNGHPLVNNEGGGGQPSLEEMWDDILSSGKLLYGLAVDDAHHFKRPWDPTASSPGHGWIYVRSARLAPRDIVEAIDRGDFYSSTGVELASLDVTPRRLSIQVRELPSSKYRIRFIGKHGQLLAEVAGPSASYDVKGTEGYVRAVVHESNGKRAWVQPVMVGAGQ
jgi:hypothetical protein